MGKSITVLLVLFCLTAPYLINIKASYADVAENSWTSKASMHKARSNLGVAVVNGKIYAIGGSTQNGSSPYTGGVVSTNEEYDPVSDTWILRASMPTPRQSFAITVYQNKIYCIGGFAANGEATGVNEAYDPATDTWETKAAMLTTRIALDANTVNGKIYLVGGYLPGEYTTYTFTSSTLNEAYDPATNSWTSKRPLPNGASSYASAVVGNRIYIMGGVSNTAVGTLNQVYNSETDTWSEGGLLPASTSYATAAVTTGVDAPKRIYVFGKDNGALGPLKAIRIYNPENDSWTFGSKIPTERQFFGVAALNDTFYVIGGRTTIYQPIPFQWDIASITVYATNQQFIPIGYGTVAPVICLVSPQNSVYNETNITVSFTISKPVSWIDYSLDGQENVTITGNTTLSGVTSGLHNVTVYAKDKFGNIGASETVTFNVAKPESVEPASFQINSVLIVLCASVIIIAVCLLAFLKRRRR